MIIAPCKNCSDREIGCHAECEKYKKWAEEEKERNKKIAENLKDRFYTLPSKKREEHQQKNSDKFKYYRRRGG